MCGIGEIVKFLFIFKQNAVAAAAASPYPGQYAGFEAYPYTSAAGKWFLFTICQFGPFLIVDLNMLGAAAASYMTPYGYTTLPQSGGVAGGIPGLSPYQQAANASLQEARLQ